MAFSPEEESHQLELLSEVRWRHHYTLTREGIGRRIMDAHVPVNHLADTSPVSEGTLLFASRKKIGTISVGLLWGGAQTLGGSCSQVPDMLTYAGTHPLVDAVRLNRIDATKPGSGSGGFCWVGFQELDDTDEPARLTPLDGIEVADLEVLAGMVNELEVLRLSGALSCLSEEGLINDSIVGWSSQTSLP